MSRRSEASFVELFVQSRERAKRADQMRRQARREAEIAVHGLRDLGLPWSTIASLVDVSREYVRQLDLGYRPRRSARDE